MTSKEVYLQRSLWAWLALGIVLLIAYRLVGHSQQVVVYGPVSSIASGSVAMTTGAITAGTCGTTVTVAAPAVTTTDVIVTAFNAAPNGTQAGLTAWPTAGNVNFAYCGIAETPAAMTINWKVTR